MEENKYFVVFGAPPRHATGPLNFEDAVNLWNVMRKYHDYVYVCQVALDWDGKYAKIEK